MLGDDCLPDGVEKCSCSESEHLRLMLGAVRVGRSNDAILAKCREDALRSEVARLRALHAEVKALLDGAMESLEALGNLSK